MAARAPSEHRARACLPLTAALLVSTVAASSGDFAQPARHQLAVSTPSAAYEHATRGEADAGSSEHPFVESAAVGAHVHPAGASAIETRSYSTAQEKCRSRGRSTKAGKRCAIHHSSAELYEANESITRQDLSVFVISYNHDEACDVSARQHTVHALIQEIEIADASEPDIIVMMSQELRKWKDWSIINRQGNLLEPAFQTAINFFGNKYARIGRSGIVGVTKPLCGFTLNTMHDVLTDVQVAVKTESRARLIKVLAQSCDKADQTVCKEEKSEKTSLQVRGITQRTKGYASIHLGLQGINLRFVSVHLDTEEFEKDLGVMAPKFKSFEEDKPGLTIVAGDFNNRMDPGNLSRLCPDPDQKVTNQSLIETLQNSSNVRGILHLDSIRDVLESNSVMEADLIPPATAEVGGISFLLPTYKYPPEVEETIQNASQLVGGAADIFGATYKNNACVKKGGTKVQFGVLDSIWTVRGRNQVPKVNVHQDGLSRWRKVKGSDHAIVSALIRIEAPQS